MNALQEVMKMPNPLRYEITDWHQAVNAMSNNSPELKLKITDFINDDRLTGLRISVWHQQFGTIFACVLNADGSFVDNTDGNVLPEFSTVRILEELAKYGFYIVYKQKQHLPSDQIEYLKTVQNLDYDKLRFISVQIKERFGETHYTKYIVVFNIEKNPRWLDINHVASESEFTEALRNGSAVNISEQSKKFRWDWNWLNFVANISDIIEENAT